VRALAAALGLLLVTGAGATAKADDTEVCPTNPLDAIRYQSLFATLKLGQAPAKRWWFSWTSAYGVATLSQGVLAAVTTDRGTRIDSIVGAAESAVGVIGMLTSVPHTQMWAPTELEKMDARTPCDRERRLRRAEELLRRSAKEEEQGRAWYTQVLGAVVNLAAPAVLWIGYKRYASGWYTLGPGIAIQEAQILTQPKAAIGAWLAYERSLGKHDGVSVSFTPLLGGGAVSGTF
jgi:hypothetical protein